MQPAGLRQLLLALLPEDARAREYISGCLRENVAGDQHFQELCHGLLGEEFAALLCTDQRLAVAQPNEEQSQLALMVLVPKLIAGKVYTPRIATPLET
jgi:hypothetical protein